MTEELLESPRRYGPLRRDRLSERQVTRELTCHLSRIERTAALARGAIDGLGDLHCYTTSEAVDTVILAQDLITSASQSGQLTTAKQQEFQQLTKVYLANVSRVTNMASQEVTNRLLEESVNGRAGDTVGLPQRWVLFGLVLFISVGVLLCVCLGVALFCFAVA